MLGTALLAGGCATKKHVRAQLAPLEASVQALQSKTDSHARAIEDLSEKMRRDVARLEETDQGMEGEIQAVAGETRKAGQLAAGARTEARDARHLAERGLAELNRLESNLGNYLLAGEETVYFARGASALDQAGRKAVSRLIAKLQGEMYLFEVVGYTDATGPAALNLELSRRRAESVVRELVSTHKIPVRHIHNVGLGKQDPVAENRTAAGRKQNRRVEIRLYTLELKEEGAKPARVSQLR